MFKLEKKPHSPHITVSMREKEKFFSPLFLKAFFCATLLHIGTLFLFQVQPFASSSNFLFPPVEVNSENSPFFTAPSLIADEHEKHSFFPSPPKLAGIPPSPLLNHPTLREQILDLNPIPFPSFERLEQRYWPAPPSSPIERAAVKVFVSGELAQNQIVHQAERFGRVINSVDEEPFRVSYQVKAEEKSEAIFWHKCIAPSGSKEADAIAEKMLLDCKFQTPFSAPILSGWLHFEIFI